MPVFNAASFLPAAIRSVLGQTFTDFEFVIVDDGSTDDSRAIASSFDDPRIRVLGDGTHRGLARSLNHGLAAIDCEYVARLDADDLAFPERLARQVAWLDRNPAVGVLGVQAVPINARGQRLRRVEWSSIQWERPSDPLSMDWYRMFDTPLVHSGVMFRRRLVVEVLGGYAVDHELTDDSELWMRAARHARLANLSERLVAYRFHAGSMTTLRDRDSHAIQRSAINHEVMRDVLRTEDLPERWAELWVRVSGYGVRAADVDELVTMIGTCRRQFLLIHPGAASNRFILRHTASLVGRVANRLMEVRMRTAMHFLTRMAGVMPLVMLRVLPDLVRILALGSVLAAARRLLRR
jgi:glycosyltransferase involved in cell wall biosynthesis